MAAIAAFFMGPLGRWVAIGIAFLAWTAYQREQAATKARAECQSAQLRVTIEEITRQRDEANAALEAAEDRLDVDLVELGKLQKERDALVAGAAKNSCNIPAADLDRLRAIR